MEKQIQCVGCALNRYIHKMVADQWRVASDWDQPHKIYSLDSDLFPQNPGSLISCDVPRDVKGISPKLTGLSDFFWQRKSVLNILFDFGF